MDEDTHALRPSLTGKNIAMREVTTFNNYDFFICNGEDPEPSYSAVKSPFAGTQNSM